EKGWNKENYEAGEGGIAYYSKGPFKFLSGSWDNTVGGLKEDFFLGESLGIMVGLKQEFKFAGSFEFTAAWGWEIATEGVTVITPESKRLEEVETSVTEDSTRIGVVERAITVQGSNIIGDKVDSIENSTDVISNKVLAIETAIGVRNDVSAIDQSITRVVGTKIATIETNLNNIEEDINNIVTQVNTFDAVSTIANLDNEEVETTVSTSALRIQTDDLHVIN
ncbi:MAG: hypothetical protein U9R27_10120, partial [Campylobacterota bacterium]|nr:hypothetical protein [Campylobacterota bacterium]